MKDISMKNDELDDFLYQGRILRLATRGKGWIHLVPIWYIFENNKIYIHTGAKSVKVKDIQRNGKVAMCVDSGSFYYDLKNARMLGRARVLDDIQLARNIAEKIQVKYLGSSSHPQAKEYLSKERDDVVVEIEILKRYSEDYSLLLNHDEK